MMKSKQLSFFFICFTILFLLFSCSAKGESDTAAIHISAAASMTDALNEISSRFSKETGIKIVLSFASSSISAKQIKEGKNCTLFISANDIWMDYLKELYIPSTRQVLLKNSLVLIAPLSSPVKAGTPDKLLEWDKLRLAMGDPAHVPAGLYGKALLLKFGFWENLKTGVIGAMDVRAALSLVESGAVDAGIVYRTDALTSKKVKIIHQFSPDYPEINYSVSLFDSHRPSIEFYDYLFNDFSQSVFEKYGFLIPGRLQTGV